MTRFTRFVRRLEDLLLVVILGLMIGLAVFQILLRNVFEEGLVWADPLLRILVLWVTILGAIAASRDDNNISISAFRKILPPRLRPLARVLTGLFTAGVCGLVAWHGTRFVVMDLQDGMMAYEKVPAWMAELIIPLGFGLMTLRYLAMAVVNLRELLSGGEGA